MNYYNQTLLWESTRHNNQGLWSEQRIQPNSTSAQPIQQNSSQIPSYEWQTKFSLNDSSKNLPPNERDK